MVKDDDLPIDSCSKTLQRFRKKLSAIKDEDGNNLVTINSFYTQTPDGKYKGHGTEYDFRKLYDYLIQKYETEEPIGLTVPTGEEPTGLGVQAEPEEGTPIGLTVPAKKDSQSDMYRDIEIQYDSTLFRTGDTYMIMHLRSGTENEKSLCASILSG